MMRNPLALLCQLLAVALGLAGPVALVASLTPAKTPPRVVILNTACWSAAAWAYSDPAAATGIVADNAAYLSQVLNFVWCREYAGAHTPIFANYGRAGCLEAHVISVRKAVAVPGVTSLVYINAPGGLGNFINADDTLLLESTLEEIGAEYPETAPDVAVYRDALRRSVGYASARLKRLEDDCKKLQDKLKGLKEPSQPKPSDWAESPFAPAGLRHAIFADMFTRCDQCLDALTFFPLSRSRLINLLDQSAKRQLDVANDKPFRQSVAKEDYWSAAGGPEVWQAFANIIAKMCKARNITLVYYIPPHVHVSDEEYRTEFMPAFVDRVVQTFRAHDNALVLDHAQARCVDPAECIWYAQKPGLFIKAGILYNMIGKLKQARHLVSALIDHDLIADSKQPPSYLGSAWPGENKLPPGNPEVRLVAAQDRLAVQEEILWEACWRKSCRLLLGEQFPLETQLRINWLVKPPVFLGP